MHIVYRLRVLSNGHSRESTVENRIVIAYDILFTLLPFLFVICQAILGILLCWFGGYFHFGGTGLFVNIGVRMYVQLYSVWGMLSHHVEPVCIRM